jgi:hypothetical protein
MKIDGRGTGLSPIIEKTQAEKSTKVENLKQEGKLPVDSVDTRLSSALRSVLDGISQTGLNAGDVHSNVSSKSVARLLDESPVSEVKKVRSPAELLSMADQLSQMMSADPQRAVQAFGAIKADRVTELLS